MQWQTPQASQEACARKQPVVSCLQVPQEACVHRQPVVSLPGRIRGRGIGPGGADHQFLFIGFFLGLFPASTPAFGGLPFTLGFFGVCPAPLEVVIGVIGHPSFLFGIRLLRCIRCVRRTILGFAGVGVVFLGLGFSELGILWVVKLVTLACHAIQSPRSEVFMQLQHVLLRKAEAKVGQSQCHCRFGGLPRPAGKVNDRGGGHGLHAAGVEGIRQEVVEGGFDRVVPPFIAGVLVA